MTEINQNSAGFEINREIEKVSMQGKKSKIRKTLNIFSLNNLSNFLLAVTSS